MQEMQPYNQNDITKKQKPAADNLTMKAEQDKMNRRKEQKIGKRKGRWNMEERVYQIGGIALRMCGVPFHEDENLRKFRTQKPSAAEVCYSVAVAPSLPLPSNAERKIESHELRIVESGSIIRYLLRDGTDEPLVRECVTDGIHRVTLSENALPLWDSNLAVKLWQLPQQLIARKEIFLHASFLAYDGKAILFTGPKQIGKSTQAELWRRTRGATVMNGDRALLRKENGSWYACGSPFCGTSKICTAGQLPLSAIVILQQGTENTAVAATPRETVAAMLGGCTYNTASTDETGLVIDIAAELLQSVSVIKLTCLPNEGAVECLQRALHL